MLMGDALAAIWMIPMIAVLFHLDTEAVVLFFLVLD